MHTNPKLTLLLEYERRDIMTDKANSHLRSVCPVTIQFAYERKVSPVFLAGIPFVVLASMLTGFLQTWPGKAFSKWGMDSTSPSADGLSLLSHCVRHSSDTKWKLEMDIKPAEIGTEILWIQNGAISCCFNRYGFIFYHIQTQKHIHSHNLGSLIHPTCTSLETTYLDRTLWDMWTWLCSPHIHCDPVVHLRRWTHRWHHNCNKEENDMMTAEEELLQSSPKWIQSFCWSFWLMHFLINLTLKKYPRWWRQVFQRQSGPR